MFCVLTGLGGVNNISANMLCVLTGLGAFNIINVNMWCALTGFGGVNSVFYYYCLCIPRKFDVYGLGALFVW